MNKEIITKLLKSSNPDDNLLGLELQYQAFKHGYTNWYKREKYNREFSKRIYYYLFGWEYDEKNRDRQLHLMVGSMNAYKWFKTRLEEAFKDNML